MSTAHQEAFKKDHEQRRGQALMPMSPYATSHEIAGLEEHRYFVVLLTTLFREADYQTLDSGLYEFNMWAERVDLKQIDGYLQYRVLPQCVNEIKLRCHADAPSALDARLYHFCRLLNILGRAGATLSSSNAVNSVWEIVSQQAQEWGMSTTLARAEMGIKILLAGDRQRQSRFSMILHNVNRAIVPLTHERTAYSREWLGNIMQWHRNYLEEVIFPIWPSAREFLEQSAGALSLVYKAVEEVYHAEVADLYTTDDVRYWVLTLLRRLQEEFAEQIQQKDISEHDRVLAANDFDAFENTIRVLTQIRVPQGEAAAYEAAKFPANPFKSVPSETAEL